MKDTIGLAAMKMKTASAKRATPPQKRRGTWGIRNCWPGSKGPPPRSNGSNGRYRRGTLFTGDLTGAKAPSAAPEAGGGTPGGFFLCHLTLVCRGFDRDGVGPSRHARALLAP